MTGGLGQEITERRKTYRLNDLFASQTHDFLSCGRLLTVHLDGKRRCEISMPFLIRIGLIAALFGAVACAPAVVTPLPQNVRRIAVLPPYQAGAVDARTGADSGLPVLQNMTVGDVLAQQARIRLAEKGFEVLSPSAVKVATKNRVPTSPQMAAQILREANLDAVALYIEVLRWVPTMSGMKTDGVIVALDVTIVDKTGTILWQLHRSARPVPLYGVLLTGQANVVVAETVMREVLALAKLSQPNA
jgi:hypothetical protein